MDRRNFIQNLILSGISAGLAGKYFEDIHQSNLELEEQLYASSNEDQYWQIIRNEYTVSSNIINLNNGGVSPQPKKVQDAHIRFYQYSNEAPSYYMWHILDKGREALRRNLADLAGCEPDEIAINRNATEGLNSIIFGLDLKPGDEIILSKYDYPNMKNAWMQREKREGVKLKWVDLPVPCEDKKMLIEAFTNPISDKTKIIHLTHAINWSGQVTPAMEIGQIAAAKNIKVILDGAHSFGQIDFKIPELKCPFFATSLHKWLGAPFGSGLMYIQKDYISSIWALLSADQPDGNDIKKFESLGTRSFASEMAIGTALDFHNMIGTARKQQRLNDLKNYWIDQVKNISSVKIYSPENPELSCSIGVFGIEGLKATEISSRLFDEYKIHTVAIEHEAINGVRVTPNVYTLEKDLEVLVKAIKKIAS